MVAAVAALLSGGMALSSGNPADVNVASSLIEEDPAGADGILEDDAPVVEGVFSDDEVVEEADSKSARVDKFFNGLTSENIKERVSGLYATNVQFSGPFAKLTGQDALVNHYMNLFSGLKSFSLEITEEFISGQETVLLWELTFANDSLNSGKELKIEGVSHLTFAGDLIISQHDFYDAGAAVYEHVTIIGRLVRWVKGKVAGV